MSRSSTANTNTPTVGMVPFSPAWTMDSGPNSQPQPTPPAGSVAMPLGPVSLCHYHFPRASSSCDRSSVSSHSTSSGGATSEYCVPRFSAAPDCWYDRPRPVSAAGTPHVCHGTPPIVPPKSPKPHHGQGTGSKPLPPTAPCPCCPPSRPPKPQLMSNSTLQYGRNSDQESPSKKKMKKPPMPLPLPVSPASVPPSNTAPVCLCHHYPGVVLQQPMHQAKHDVVPAAYSVGPYENYDVPKSLLSATTHPKESVQEETKPDEHHASVSSQLCDEYYDTPKNLKDCLGSPAVCDTLYGNYDTPPIVKTLRKPCGCIIKYTTKKSVVITSQVETSRLVSEHDEITTTSANCPCQRVMCWAENWMMLPYCRRGNGVENTGVPIHKVRLSGEGKMPVVNASGEIAIYATIDKSKKTNRHITLGEQEYRDAFPCPVESQVASSHAHTSSNHDSCNYVNVEPASENTACSVIPQDNADASQEGVSTNYENIDFAQSLGYYENAKDVLLRAGISQQDVDKMNSELNVRNVSEDSSVSYTVNNGVKFCNKCGHVCHIQQTSTEQDRSDVTTPDKEADSCTRSMTALTESTAAHSNRQDDYLMMEPTKHLHNEGNENFPGYLPMSPITNTNTPCSTLKVDQGLPSEKSASIPSLTATTVDRSRKRTDFEFPRVPGSAMMMMHHSANSPYLRRLLMDTADDTRRTQILTRKRSSSADSSRYLDGDCENFNIGLAEHPISSSQTKLSNSLPDRETSTCAETVVASAVVSAVEQQQIRHGTEAGAVEGASTPLSGQVPVATQEETDSGSASSGSLRTLVKESGVTDETQRSLQSQHEIVSPSSVHIRRSSSVPCKGNNRDSSSSNDSGVSTGSLRQRGADFAEFELPLTTAMSARRHHHALAARHTGSLCLHSSLPRRSKSVDPLRELSFQFQKIKIPAKSSSAEAEVPICPAKQDGVKGFQSPAGDGIMVAPYMDSRSTSSGTSDMSDYIETLSLSSHSSSDTPDSLRFGRPATTTLRPRSGKEYQLIDRSILEGDMKAHCTSSALGDKGGHQLRGLLTPYVSITPVPEKSESPSPGYISGSPGQEREDQPLIPHAYTK